METLRNKRMPEVTLPVDSRSLISKPKNGPHKFNRTFNTLQTLLNVEKIKTDILREDQFLQKVVQLSSDFIYVLDIQRWEVVFHNAKLSAMLGYKPDGSLRHLAETDFAEVIFMDDLPAYKAHYQYVSRKLKVGEVAEKEFHLKHRDGSDRWILTREVSFKTNAKGEITHIMGTAVDITNRKKAEAEIEESVKKSEDAARIKSEFVSAMCQEIRTPMNAIIGLTEVLLHIKSAPEDNQYLNTIKYSADNLMVILNDIQDFSKIESGHFNIESSRFRLTETLEHLYRIFDFKAGQKGLSLLFDVDRNIPQMLIGDAHRLNQVLINLIGNAIKFTLHGHIALLVSIVAEDENGIDLKFQVSDTGIGIEQDKLVSIFDSFSQVHDNDAKQFFGGTGLGLSISRKITALMGGELCVESQHGEGSTFSFTLYFEKEAATSTSAKQSSDAKLVNRS